MPAWGEALGSAIRKAALGGAVIMLMNWAARNPNKGIASLSLQYVNRDSDQIPEPVWTVTLTHGDEPQTWTGPDLEKVIAEAVLSAVYQRKR